MTTRLEIFTLGGVRIQRAGEPVIGLSTKKAEALLIYLAATKRPQPREMLAELLWDERTQSQAMGNLRVVLTNLRQVLGDYLVITREDAGINIKSDIWLDAADLDHRMAEVHQQGPLYAATAKQLADVLELYTGEFLQGFSVFDCRGFDGWSVRERERLHHLAVDGFSELVNYEFEQGEYQHGMAHASRLLELDPLMENAHRQMMELLAISGQRTAALSQYESCQKLLKTELGVDPAIETQNLYEQIRSGKPMTREESELLPKGTVTFLFTAIDDSAQLLQQLRQKYSTLLAGYRRILQEAFARWNGHEVDTQGDTVLVAFSRATQAIGAAVEIQHALSAHTWPGGIKPSVQMGIHTGEPWNASESYISMDLHRAARIASVGHGGQVLLSQTTSDLVGQDLTNGMKLRDLGAYMLKDLPHPQEIYQLEVADLPSEFPPLKSLDKLEKEEESPAPGKSPYLGLQYFDEEDAEWFFGRQAVIDRLVDAACSDHFLAVIGASGSGKSSVVRAGLVPAMKKISQPRWQVKVITPSSHPLDALAISLTSESESITATTTLIDDMEANLRSLYLYCQKNLGNHKDERLLLVIDQFEELFTLCRSESERLAFVTNLLYAACVPDSIITVIITLRADFYEHLAQYVGLREMVSTHQIYIGAMDESELREAIEAPAKRGGWELLPGLVDLILSDLGASTNHPAEPGALPLLSHALLETWKRRRGNRLTLKAYTEAGGVRGAIAKTAESVFHGELTLAQQKIAKDIFLRLTELGEGTQDTRRRISIHELIPPGPAVEAEQVQAVLLKLADARLVTTGEGTVEVAHEALIREWPTLREWLAADREILRLHRHLTEAAQEWELLERDPGAMYRGTRLNQALEWAMANPRALNLQEQAFLEASHQAEESEQAEREAQRQRELDSAQKIAETEKGRAEAERQRAEEQGLSAQRLRRRAWSLAGVLVLALILAGAAIGFWRQADSNAALARQNLDLAQGAEQRALSQKSTAESESLRAEVEAQSRATAEALAEQEREIAQDQARLATSRELTTAALSHLGLDPQLSAHLALQAIQVYPQDTAAAENALHQVIPELRLLSSTPITTTQAPFINTEFTFSMARNGERLIQITPHGIKVVDWASGSTFTFAVDRNCVAINPSKDGRWLVALCEKSGLKNEQGNPIFDTQVWDVDAQKLLFTLPDKPDRSPDQMYDYPLFKIIPPSQYQPLLVIGGGNGEGFQVWDVSSGQELDFYYLHSSLLDNSLYEVISSPDGKYLVTIYTLGSVKLWDLENLTELGQFDSQAGRYPWADFSPDGSRLAVIGDSGSIMIWDITADPFIKLENRINCSCVSPDGLFFSPDGTYLAAGSQDGYIRVWDVHTGSLQLILAGQAGRSWPLAFNQDGNRLYSFSGGNILEWDLMPSHETLTLPGRIGSMPFSPDGSRLALIGVNNTISIVDSQTGEVIVPPWKAHIDWIEDIAWSPDGTQLASVSGNFNDIKMDNTARIWDALTGRMANELSTEGGYHLLAWSPDGSRLLASGFDTGTTSIFSTSSWEAVGSLKSPDADFALAYSPDGQSIATSSVFGIAVRDAISGSEVFTYTVGKTTLSLAISPNGQQLAAGLTNGSILLFTMAGEGAKKEELGFAGGESLVYSLAFSPGGTLLAAGDAAGKVRVWDVASRQTRLELQAFSDGISRVAFSPDGSRLLASSLGGKTYFYVLPLDELVELARSRIIIPMTIEECQDYLHQETCPEEP